MIPMPHLSAQTHKLYSVAAPLTTHWRSATCLEVDCPNFLNGWKVRVEGLPDELLYAAKTSGRKYVQMDVGPGETYLVFEAGQQCFAQHTTSLDRPAIFAVRSDLIQRGRPFIHSGPDAWLDDFDSHQQTLRAQQERG